MGHNRRGDRGRGQSASQSDRSTPSPPPSLTVAQQSRSSLIPRLHQHTAHRGRAVEGACQGVLGRAVETSAGAVSC